MDKRRGEKIGWLGGWIGGFIWVGLMALIFLLQGNFLAGLVGWLLFGVAMLLIFVGAPWKHPATPYWKLMLPLYLVFFGAAAWLIYIFGGMQELGFNGWSAFWILVFLMPLITLGRRRWNDFNH
jgi:hypothetical protein